MLVPRNALRHGWPERDVRWAVEHALVGVLHLGPSRDGRLLEVLVIVNDIGEEITIHTEELLGRVADEAETGFAPDRLCGPGRPRLSPGTGPSAIVQVRIDEELQKRLAHRALQESTSVSAVVREALRAHLG